MGLHRTELDEMGTLELGDSREIVGEEFRGTARQERRAIARRPNHMPEEAMPHAINVSRRNQHQRSTKPLTDPNNARFTRLLPGGPSRPAAIADTPRYTRFVSIPPAAIGPHTDAPPPRRSIPRTSRPPPIYPVRADPAPGKPRSNNARCARLLPGGPIPPAQIQTTHALPGFYQAGLPDPPYPHHPDIQTRRPAAFPPQADIILIASSAAATSPSSRNCIWNSRE